MSKPTTTTYAAEHMKWVTRWSFKVGYFESDDDKPILSGRTYSEIFYPCFNHCKVKPAILKFCSSTETMK